MMKMESNCDLELRLLSSSFESNSISSTEELNSSQKDESQRMTIFYNGKMCVSDVTDLQARAIISLFERGVEERSSSRSRPNDKLLARSHHHQNQHDQHQHHHHHQTSSLPLRGSNSAAFMKKSLQRFLQNRRDRVQASCPYHS